MINLLANDVWNGAINVVVDIFMKIMDWMWALKLPGTNIPLFVIWVIGGVINVIFLLVNSSRGLSSVSRASLEASSNIAKGVKGTVSFSYKSGKKVGNYVGTRSANKKARMSAKINKENDK
ncbi:hypothetical protein [Spiroplasma citri]|uniref:Plectrovirus SVGII3 orf 5 transmembrane protein n=1 Tax=Spiroplasma citri TaxID=2133 RepID=Q14KD9_SPICI|nr:hypothetical protein [Spiroplasma citri]APE74928.1 plectrovirus-related protein [Spiroplasma citri]CAK99004.1 probable plectrovirus SVGII3 orf 5 transmembrane protein [Spiroplasma citri]CAL00041.1 plectrovirus SVGII3 orf 5 transmembrane protein [Spiroplasma citri]